MLKAAVPVVRISSSEDAERFYKTLGFQRQFSFRPDPSQPDPCYFGIARDGVVLHLSSFSGDGVLGGVVYVWVDDVDALHSELVRNGVAIDSGPVDQTWGTRELYVRDPDRNSIRFGQTR